MMVPTSRRIIINADDFGLHPSVNEAIERGHCEGVITSASLMTLGDASDDAVRRARGLSTLDLGLHFCLVGVPGFPHSLGAFLAAYARGLFPSRRIEDVLRRQLDLALRTHRLPISHIDAHQHLHAFPSLMRVVCRVAAEHDIFGIRLPVDGPAHTPIGPGRRIQAAALCVVSRLSRHYITASGRRTTDNFSGMAVSGHLSAETLGTYLESSRPGTTEIVCHPGSDNPALGSLFRWGYDWEGELAAVTNQKPREAVMAQGIEMISWRNI